MGKCPVFNAFVETKAYQSLSYPQEKLLYPSLSYHIASCRESVVTYRIESYRVETTVGRDRGVRRVCAIDSMVNPQVLSLTYSRNGWECFLLRIQRRQSYEALPFNLAVWGGNLNESN